MNRAKLKELNKKYGNSLFFQCYLRNVLIDCHADKSARNDDYKNRKRVKNG